MRKPAVQKVMTYETLARRLKVPARFVKEAVYRCAYGSQQQGVDDAIFELFIAGRGRVQSS